MKKKRYRLLPVGIVLSFVAVLVVVIIKVYATTQVDLRMVAMVEAGSNEPLGVGLFFNGEQPDATFVTDVSTLDLSEPTEYALEIQYKEKIYPVRLRVVDTTPPTATLASVTLVAGQRCEAADFVTYYTDVTAVSISFKSSPNFDKTGEQDITILLSDAAGNVAEKKTQLYIVGAKAEFVTEAGMSAQSLKAVDFLTTLGESRSLPARFVRQMGQNSLDTPGVYDVAVVVDGITLESVLRVTDTTPPTATPVEQTIWLGEVIEADALVSDVRDYSDVTVYYKQEPDYETAGDQTVYVTLEDAFGNRADIPVTLTIMADTEPPVIYGAGDQFVLLGDSVSFRSGVWAEDNKDGELPISVDSSAFNQYAVGNYSVYYSATDAAGNKGTKTITVSVVEVDPDEVYRLADNVLASIIDDSMSLYDKAERIHRWVRNNIKYSSSTEKSDVFKAAFYAFKKRQGDCYFFYAISEVLLTRVGIDNMRVTRVGGTSQHFWNLVNVGAGWYHFDTCPTRVSVNTFMFTSKDAEAYTEKITHVPNYYVYDKSLYPPIVGDEDA